MPITVKDKGKENDKRALNNMKAIPLNAVSKQKRPNQQSITPRETHKQSNGFGYIWNQKQKNLNKAHQDQRVWSLAIVIYSLFRNEYHEITNAERTLHSLFPDLGKQESRMITLHHAIYQCLTTNT